MNGDEPEGSPAWEVFYWLLGDEGQMLVDLEGYATKTDR
jgi:hypothetical protein